MKVSEIRKAIERIYCSRAAYYYGKFCAVVDALTDEELSAVCEALEAAGYGAGRIASAVSDLDFVADALEVDVEEIEGRM